MGFLAVNYSVGTVVALICPADSNPQNFHVHNNSEHTIYVGGSDVTTSSGLNVLKQTTEEFYVVPGDAVYAISNGADRDIRTIRWRR
jgi:uncharacterized RmlC-like cupin family protein